MVDAQNDKELEEMNITVDEAMKPLDEVANKLKQIRVREQDKSEIDSAVEEVKKGVKAAILENVVTALGTNALVEVHEVKPAPMRPVPKKSTSKKADTKKVPVKVSAKVEPVVQPKKDVKKATGKKVPLDAKGLIQPELPVIAPAPVPVPTPAKKVNKDKGKTKAVATPPKEGLRGTSTVLKPTKLVWAIAEDMIKKNPKATRKDILAACDKAGITYYTARTQYQLWRSSKGK